MEEDNRGISEMVRRVGHLSTANSEEHVASIFRVKGIH
jgi:hypothetical protein